MPYESEDLAMEVKQAVKIAKEYVSELMSDEGIENLGLEEVQFDEVASQWLVTTDFSLYYAVASRDYRAAVNFNALRDLSD